MRDREERIDVYLFRPRTESRASRDPGVRFALVAFAIITGLVVSVSVINRSNANDIIPAEKQAYEDRLDQARAEAMKQSGAPKNPVDIPSKDGKSNPPDLSAQSTPASPFRHTPAGLGTIVETGLAPYSASQYVFENHWYMTKGPGEVIVYAGAEYNDPSQGLVAVRDTSGDGSGIFRTDAKVGTLRVVGAEGTRIVLEAADGTRVIFDLVAAAFE
jgi:hypothetical protein